MQSVRIIKYCEVWIHALDLVTPRRVAHQKNEGSWPRKYCGGFSSVYNCVVGKILIRTLYNAPSCDHRLERGGPVTQSHYAENGTTPLQQSIHCHMFHVFHIYIQIPGTGMYMSYRAPRRWKQINVLNWSVSYFFTLLGSWHRGRTDHDQRGRREERQGERSSTWYGRLTYG